MHKIKNMKHLSILLVIYINCNSFLYGQIVVGNISNNNSNVTLSIQNVELAFNQYFQSFDNSANVIIDSIKIEDDINDTSDLASIHYYYRLTVNYETDILYIITRYPVNYILASNEYELDTLSSEVIGGKFQCKKFNCRGCYPKESPPGNWDCTPSCIAIDPEKGTGCSPVWSDTEYDSGGWETIFNGLTEVPNNLGILLGQI